MNSKLTKLPFLIETIIFAHSFFCVYSSRALQNHIWGYEIEWLTFEWRLQSVCLFSMYPSNYYKESRVSHKKNLHVTS